jgi:hypothetical protein
LTLTAYNAAGQRINTLSPGGQTIDYQWSGSRISAISVNGQPVIHQIGYDPDGQVNGWTWGNNQQHERFHDLTGKPVIVSLSFDPTSQQPAQPHLRLRHRRTPDRCDRRQRSQSEPAP